MEKWFAMMVAGVLWVNGIAAQTAEPTRINSLGMEWVRLPESEVWMAVHETRVADYRKFVEATGHQSTRKTFSLLDGRMARAGARWDAPGFEQDEDHPVTCVSWEDAMAFCDWLTRVEREAGNIQPGQHYSLPTDAEWSLACGIVEDPDLSPQERWERVWLGFEEQSGDETEPSPTEIQANFADSKKVPHGWNPGWEVQNGGLDGYAQTAPVGSFQPNAIGIHDLEGNVWEWVFDYYDGRRGHRLGRGGSWMNSEPFLTQVLARMPLPSTAGYWHSGFRCVLR